MKMEEVTPDLYGRIGQLEVEVSGIKTDVHHLRGEMGHIGEAIGKLSDKLANNKTDWKMLAAWASVILAIMVYHGELVITPIENQITQMDITLQREMRLLDGALEQKAHSLDTQLQREMRLLDDIMLSRLKRLEETAKRDVNSLENRILINANRIREHQKDGHPHVVHRRVDALEKDIDRLMGVKGSK